MFCPECKAEYRPGFTHCNDCDVDLVNELPELAKGPGEPLSDSDFMPAWAGPDQGECAAICDRLHEAEIPYKVVQQADDFFFGGAGARFEIRVPPDALEETREIAREIIDQHKAEDGEEMEEAELLDEEEEDDAPLEDDPGQNRHWDPRNCLPEDATVEVWSGDDMPQAEMVEVSLREHRIYSRTEALKDGSQQIFVMPEQELRAREIVRQIVDATQR